MPKEDPFVNRAQLLKAIKKYPEIWDSNNKLHMCRSVTAPMWNEIAEQFGGHVPTVKLQSIWSQMKYHYHNLVHRQILHKERFTTKWEHFEPMSFMYNITVSKIIGSSTTTTAAAATTTTPASANSTNNNNNINNNNNNSISNGNKNIKGNLLLPLLCPDSSVALSQGRGRPSGTFTWLTSSPPSPPNVFSSPMSMSTSTSTPATTTTTTTTTTTSVCALPATFSTSGLGLSIDGHGFAGIMGTIIPAHMVSVETISNTVIRKPGRPGSMHSGLRGRIIDAISIQPAIWGSRQRDQQRHSQCQNRTSKIWKEIATQLGLTPTLIQTRWAIIKQRYVDELQKERYAHYARQPFQSTWEHFERMSFMRDILIKKVDEREQTREHIREIVNEQQQQQQQQQQEQLHHQQMHHEQQHHQHHHQHQQQHHELVQNIRYGVGRTSAISSLELCPDGSESICDAAGNAFIGMTEMSSLNAVTPALHMIGGGVGSRRSRATAATIKTEAEMEWDPFEMILHVHGGEAVAADLSSPTNNN